jgi:hypothetical protein
MVSKVLELGESKVDVVYLNDVCFYLHLTHRFGRARQRV